MADDEPSKRTRNAAATRDAILHSALLAFSRAGYDGAGLREIAGDAGVTAILVNRYFGSKEALFSAAVEVAFSDGGLFAGDIATLSKRLANGIVGKADSTPEPVDPLMLMLRSAANPSAAAILRDCIASHFEDPLSESLGGRGNKERSALLLSLIAGFQLMRTIIGSKALAAGDRDVLVRQLERMFDAILTPA